MIPITWGEFHGRVGVCLLCSCFFEVAMGKAQGPSVPHRFAGVSQPNDSDKAAFVHLQVSRLRYRPALNLVLFT